MKSAMDYDNEMIHTSNETDSISIQIKDVILITHSMSNLVLAGALMNNHCNLEDSTTDW